MHDTCAEVRIIGITTVAYTFVIHHVRCVFPTISDGEALATRIGQVKTGIVDDHGVKLTEQMHQWLDTMADGSFKPPLLPTAAAGFAAYSIPARASMTPPPAAAPKGPTEPAEPAPAPKAPTEGAEPAPKRARLSDRVKRAGK